MLEDRALIEDLADAGGTADEMGGEETEDKGEAVGVVTAEIDAAIGWRKMGKEREPCPIQKNDGHSLKRNKERLNASNAVRNHDKR